MRKIRTLWSDEDIEYLKNNYHKETNQKLSQILNRNRKLINSKARLLGLKKSKTIYKNDNISILLNNSQKSLYWIGFLLADGHIENNSKVELKLAIKDELHLNIFKNYLHSLNPIRIINRHTNKKKNVQSALLTFSHKEIIGELCKKYDIQSNKTINPPSISNYKLSNEQIIAILIGYIDGDGSINFCNKQRSKCSIHLRVHKNWLNNLIFLKTKTYSFFNIFSARRQFPLSSHSFDVNGNLMINIGNFNAVKKLKEFATKNELPILKRKWDKIIL